MLGIKIRRVKPRDTRAVELAQYHVYQIIIGKIFLISRFLKKWEQGRLCQMKCID